MAPARNTAYEALVNGGPQRPAVQSARLFIPGEPVPSLNEWAWASHWAGRYRETQRWAKLVWAAWLEAGRPAFGGPVEVEVTSVVATARRRDPDNLAPKFVMDALVKCGCLPDDSARYVRRLTLAIERGERPGTAILIRATEGP